MATKSILKSIDICDKRLGRQLLTALEHAEKKNSIQVVSSKIVTEIKKGQIKLLFGEEPNERV